MKPEDLRIGQFWKDTVNGDVLKITQFNETAIDDQHPADLTVYVQCACYPRGEYFLGIQEMQARHFETERFQAIQLDRLKSLWYRWKFRKP